jgi:membrane-bound ClpP family serine protease
MRPTGKARFEDHIVDATALTGYIDEKQSVEVVAVRGLRVIVRPVRSPDERIHDSREPFRFDEGLFES